MAAETLTPPDMRMMLVAHHALRRDLQRIRTVLAGPDHSAGYRRRLHKHFGFWLWFLNHHHVAEDLGLWPALRTRCPEASELLDRMEADHHGLELLLADASRAFAEWSRWGSQLHRLRTVAALASLDAGLSDHLAREESEILPIVDRYLPDDEWQQIDRQYFHKGVGLRRVSFLSPWFLDSVDPQLGSAWMDPLPAPMQWMQRHRWQRTYTRRTEPLWRPLYAS